MSCSRRFRPGMLSAATLLSMALGVVGCGTGSSPVSYGTKVTDSESIADVDFTPLAFRIPSLGGDGSAKSLAAPIRVEGLISAELGGSLVLDWESPAADGAVGPAVKVDLLIPPGALLQDTVISISLENPAVAMVTVDLEFGEPGTQFQIPAEVTLDLKGLELAGGDDDSNDDDSNDDGPGEVSLYWYDTVQDAWFPVVCKKYKVDFDKGTVKGTWYLNHFSRYSLAD